MDNGGHRRKLRPGLLFVATLFAVVAGNISTAFAQSANTATIIGMVKDESGFALPGVTITATSPALQVPQVGAVSESNGEYRLSQLPLGTYDVTYSLAGFQTVKQEGIRLTAGFIAKIDQALKIATVTESVTVTGQGPIVDTTSTNVKTEFLKETIDVLATSRNSLNSLIQVTPGVTSMLDVGGNQTGNRGNIVTFSRAGQTTPQVEGINTRMGDGANPGAYYDYTSFEEAQIETQTHNAEIAVVGAMFNAIVKSGGNDFHGNYIGSSVSSGLIGHNLDDALRAKGVSNSSSLKKRYDVSADLGGRVLRDKLWFYTAARRQYTVQDDLGFVKPDGSPGLEPNWLTFWTIKISDQLTPSHKLIGFQQWNNKHVVGYVSPFHAFESRTDQQQPAAFSKIEWQGLFGSHVVTSLQFGHWFFDSALHGFTTNVATFDNVTLRYTGESITSPGPGSPARLNNWRWQPKGNINVFKDNWLGGSHNFKLGFDVFEEMKNWALYSRSESGDYALVFNSGVPFQIRTYNRPVDPVQRVNYAGVYFTDNWRVSRQFSFDLGVRYDRYNMFFPEQVHPAGTFAPAATFAPIQFAIWNEVVPRLHAAYDLTGNGRTVLKAGWGRFGLGRDVFEPDNWNPNGLVTNVYRWHDLNHDLLYEPGEVDLSLTGVDYVSTTGGTTRVPNPAERQPKTDEYTLWFEQQLRPSWAVRVGGRYARDTDVRALVNTLIPYSAYTVPITNIDPGPDGRGTSGGPLTYYEFPTSLHGLQFQRFINVNTPSWVNTWKTFEMAFTKRLSHNWQMMSAYSATRQDTGTPPANPNDNVFPRNQTWNYEVKMAGSYRLPWDVMVSAGLQYLAGTPYARTVLLRGGREIPTIVQRVEPIGSRRTPDISLLDMRFEKTVRFPVGKLAVMLNLSNVLNVNTPTAVTTQSGATFERPTGIVPPRTGEIGVSYKF